MSIVDAHVHLYPPEVNRDPAGWAATHGEPHWAELCTRRRKDGKPVQTFPSVDQLLRDMDAAGVAQAVLLGWYWEQHESCVTQNKFYADCIRAHPDRLMAMASLQPLAGEVALAEAVRALDDGLIGFGELSPHAQRVPLDHPVWRKIMQLAGAQKVPVNLHVTDPRSKPYPGRIATPLSDFIGLAREFPWTRFILAHWGGGLAFDTENVALPNVYFDTAASPLLYGPEVWANPLRDRILFGSDYPLILYPRIDMAPGFGGLIAEAKAAGASEAVMGGSARKLLRRQVR